MDPEIDFYAVLGILPNAADVVVVAAYRALASLYHPDRWKGDIAEATSRMADINVAYGVLGDVAKRKSYDAHRQSSQGVYGSADNEQDMAFDAALHQLESRWKIAVSVYPDLVELRKRLSKTAHSLAFAFVTVLLETKQFQNRASIAASMENEFLERYFGTSQRIISLAKELVEFGLKEAIVALNKYIEVLGATTDPAPVIARIEGDFNIVQARQARAKEREAADFNALQAQQARAKEREKSEYSANTLKKIEEMRATVRHFRNANDARQLAGMMGYEVRTSSPGFLRDDVYEVRAADSKEVISLRSPFAFVEWVVRSLC